MAVALSSFDVDKGKYVADKESGPNGPNQSGTSSITPKPSPVQLQNAVPIEIVAKRFPVDIDSTSRVNVQLNVLSIEVFSDSFQAQQIIELKVVPSQNPPPFEVSFQMVGLFTFLSDYNAEIVKELIEQNGVPIVIPFVRELLLNLCYRLQIPPIMLAIVQASGDNTGIIS